MTKQEFEKKYDKCNNWLGNIAVCKEYIASLEAENAALATKNAELERQIAHIRANSRSKLELDTCRSLNEALRAENMRLIADGMKAERDRIIKENTELKEKLNKNKITYIRFGLFGEKSLNHLTGKLENGVSVYECLFDDDLNAYRIIFPFLTESACVSLSGFNRSDWYLVDGTLCGYGSDGEPLLNDVKIVENKPNIYGMKHVEGE